MAPAVALIFFCDISVIFPSMMKGDIRQNLPGEEAPLPMPRKQEVTKDELRESLRIAPEQTEETVRR